MPECAQHLGFSKLMELLRYIDGDYRDLTDLSGQLNYHATDNFMVFGAIEYKKDSGQAYWGTPLVPTSFAGSNATCSNVSKNICLGNPA